MLLLGFFLLTRLLLGSENGCLPVKKPVFFTEIPIQGRIIGLPMQSHLVQRFVLLSQYGKLSLSWYKPYIPVHSGEFWKFYVKLKPIHILHNPGMHQRIPWPVMQGMVASGYVRHPHSAQCVKQQTIWCVDQVRAYLVAQIKRAKGTPESRGVLVALTVGAKSLILPEVNWTFQQTGTAHLVAVSGLHVGLVFAASYRLLLYFLRIFPNLFLYWPVQKIATLFATLIVLPYCLLEGMSLPTQRAFIMIALLSLSSLSATRLSLFARLVVAFILLLLVQPLSFFSASFWLSFLAVFWIFYAQIEHGKKYRFHLILSLGLLPITLYYFSQFAFIGILANIVAVPWVSFCILPLCLCATVVALFSEPYALGIWHIASLCFMPLWHILHYLGEIPIQWVHPLSSVFSVISSMIGVLFLMAPAGVPLRLLSFFFFIPLLTDTPKRPSLGEFWINTLDVGQGLSVVIQTAKHTLVYDTGPHLPHAFDAGRQVILPFLFSQGIRKVDIMAVSHGDNDHIGGASWLLRHCQVKKVLSSVPNVSWYGHKVIPCRQGDYWSWDGVRFLVLWPTVKKVYDGNNSSCVIKVYDDRGHSVLLTGDIEKPAESALVAQCGKILASEVLVAPHHGSRTSSSLKFLQYVHPKKVIISLGWHNRYHFPSRIVCRRYHALGLSIFSTDKQGAVVERFEQDKSRR